MVLGSQTSNPENVNYKIGCLDPIQIFPKEEYQTNEQVKTTY